MGEVVQDGPMDHLSVSQQHKEQRLSGQGTSERGTVVKMSGRVRRAYLQPQEETEEGRSGRRDGSECLRRREKNIFIIAVQQYFRVR